MRALGMLVALMALARPVLAQDTPPPTPRKPPVINIGPMDVIGTMRSALLLQFLERAAEELERSSLERRSFVDRIVVSVDDELL